MDMSDDYDYQEFRRNLTNSIKNYSEETRKAWTEGLKA